MLGKDSLLLKLGANKDEFSTLFAAALERLPNKEQALTAWDAVVFLQDEGLRSGSRSRNDQRLADDFLALLENEHETAPEPTLMTVVETYLAQPCAQSLTLVKRELYACQHRFRLRHLPLHTFATRFALYRKTEATLAQGRDVRSLLPQAILNALPFVDELADFQWRHMLVWLSEDNHAKGKDGFVQLTSAIGAFEDFELSKEAAPSLSSTDALGSELWLEVELSVDDDQSFAPVPFEKNNVLGLSRSDLDSLNFWNERRSSISRFPVALRHGLLAKEPQLAASRSGLRGKALSDKLALVAAAVGTETLLPTLRALTEKLKSALKLGYDLQHGTEFEVAKARREIGASRQARFKKPLAAIREAFEAAFEPFATLCAGTEAITNKLDSMSKTSRWDQSLPHDQEIILAGLTYIYAKQDT